jgi:hypothetical protein
MAKYHLKKPSFLVKTTFLCQFELKNSEDPPQKAMPFQLEIIWCVLNNQSNLLA